MKILKVLVACEESQAVCKEFRKLGHDAYSCDILEPSGGHPEWHIWGDAVKATYVDFMLTCLGEHVKCNNWDLVIAFPPCTFIANVSAPHFNVEKYGQKAIDRIQKRDYAIDFFMKFMNINNCPVAIENSKPGTQLLKIAGRANQVVHPYYFGDQAHKQHHLWLKGLPDLTHNTKDYADKGEKNIGKGGRTNYKWYHEIKSNKDRGKMRSKTFPGVAKAMAEQWSDYLCNKSDTL